MERTIEIANISLTGKCNLHCKHCGAMITSDEIPFENLNTIIKELNHYGVYHIIFSGGEPFCRNDIFEILDICEEQKIFFTILTNGTIYTEESVKRLKMYKYLSCLRISLDYDSGKRMDLFRGMSNILLKIEKFINLLKESNISFGIGMTIMNDNLDDIYLIARKAILYGADFFRASPVMAIGRSENIHNSYRFYTEAIKHMIQVREKLNIGSDYPFTMLPDQLHSMTKYFIRECPGANREISLLSNGTVNRCPLSAENESLSIYRKSLTEIIEILKKENQLFSAEKLSREPCVLCIHKLKCKGGCYAETECGNSHCYSKVLDSIFDSCDTPTLRRAFGTMVYEQKIHRKMPQCIRATSIWSIPFSGLKD